MKIEVKSAGAKGRGVFATASIKKGELIETSPYIEVPAKDHDVIAETMLENYWYHVRGKVRAIGLGLTSLYNHSLKPNADFRVVSVNKTVSIIALRQIKKGEEIVFDYGYDPITKKPT